MSRRKMRPVGGERPAGKHNSKYRPARRRSAAGWWRAVQSRPRELCQNLTTLLTSAQEPFERQNMGMY
jgi:hypothetical protein